MQDFRVIIAGGRDFQDYQLLKAKCDAILANKRHTHNIIVVSGTARGADFLGEVYAKKNGFRVERYPANWDADGKTAGPIRNAQMADAADALIAFWDGRSRGTRNMIDVATSKGLLVRTVLYNNRDVTMKNEKINAKWAELIDFATQHATQEGTRRGIAWLRDCFNDYLDLSDETPGYGMGGQPGSLFNREVLARKIALALGSGINNRHVDSVKEAVVDAVRSGMPVPYVRSDGSRGEFTAKNSPESILSELAGFRTADNDKKICPDFARQFSEHEVWTLFHGNDFIHLAVDATGSHVLDDEQLERLKESLDEIVKNGISNGIKR